MNISKIHKQITVKSLNVKIKKSNEILGTKGLAKLYMAISGHSISHRNIRILKKKYKIKGEKRGHRTIVYDLIKVLKSPLAVHAYKKRYV